ncbi:MAG TPA: type II CAAX endopeptidase family protein [Terriglobia bacterium]|nr:type II CAAX endopeptidase family protein [Terriglobia bacterium]
MSDEQPDKAALGPMPYPEGPRPPAAPSSEMPASEGASAAAPPTLFSESVEAPPRLWRPRDLLVFVAILCGGLVVCQLLVILGYALLRPLMGWHTSLSTLEQNTFFLVALQFVCYAFVLVCVYLLIVAHYRQPFWRGLQWHSLTLGQIGRYMAGGLLLAVAVQFIPALLPDNNTFPLQKLFNSPAAGYALGILSVFIAPFMEELVFRGVLYAFFERLAGFQFAIVGTAVLFAGLHVPEYWGAWGRVLVILVVGLVLSLARAVTKSLTPSVVLHMAYNATLMSALFFATHHFRTMPALPGHS